MVIDFFLRGEIVLDGLMFRFIVFVMNRKPIKSKPLYVVTANTHGLWGKPIEYAHNEFWTPKNDGLIDDCFDQGEVFLGLNQKTSDSGFFRYLTHDKKEADIFYVGAKSAIRLLKNFVNSIE